MKKSFLLILCLIAGFTSKSQPSDPPRITDSQHNAWYMYFGTYKVSPKVSIHSEVQWRRSGIIKDPQQLLLRGGLNYHLSNAVMATLGYGFIDTHPYGEQPVPERFTEHRIWQQLILNHSDGRVLFNHRFRQEQRWLELPLSDEHDYNYVNRSRYRFMLTVPLNNSEMIKDTWFLSFYDEIFINFGENVAKNIFDQNRIYGAIGFQTGINTNLQLGYLNQMIQKGNGIQFENNHTLQLAFFHTIKFGQ